MRYLLFFCIVLSFSACHQSHTLFQRIDAGTSNITFNNQITENDSINPLDMEFLYNGGGVAVGDFNRDGKPDLYFTASQVANKMYLNEGNFKFKDVTTEAHVTGEGRWCNAASVVDINNDGWPDLYVCATIKKDSNQRRNLFYINQGLNKDGVPVFKEMAKEYNLDDPGFSVHAAFFDYDRDGDLDMYLVTTTLALRSSSRFDGNTTSQKKSISDKLFRNEGSDSLGHPYFKDVSEQAGIHDNGFGLGIAIADVNNDGWKDIFVTNDFYTSDLLYINNGDGTFTDKAKTCFKHTSQNAMGNDIADINNDGLDDIITVDMNPEDNFRKKKNMAGINYVVPQNMVNNGLLLQYVRNTLQLNNGLVQTDSFNKPLPVYSDISFYAGVAETDWSWNPSLADFDNDGFKDLIITNGYPKDVTDHDFTSFRQNSSEIAPKEILLAQIPQIKIANYAFHNTGALKFDNVSADWGLNEPSFSNGAVYVDLDGDGDLDYVINNINEEAFVYKNNSTKNNNFINITFDGSAQNKNGIGATATLFYGNGQQQFFENSPYRGYLSTVDASLHFGMGNIKSIDSVLITWPDGKVQVLKNIPVNKTITVHYKDAANQVQTNPPPAPLFTNITQQSNVHYKHDEYDYVDYDIQRLLPHKLSQYGPCIAVGDVDNNGLDDIFLGASSNHDATFLYQQPDGKFTQKDLAFDATTRIREMMGALLFDADGDGDLDLYAASGSNEFTPGSKDYADRFFINNGKGNFTFDSAALPKNFTSKSCVKAVDYDHDGDLDLFIGGRVNPQHYPQPVSSFIYRNDSKNGKIIFTDVTEQVAPMLHNIGLVCDAVWTDFDNDGYPDLVLSGEWMPLTFLKNNKGKFINVTATTGLQNNTGWWNTITAGDFDNDGDIDYVAGNLGLNSFLKATDKEPVTIYAGDFNNDGTYDAIPTLYLPDEEGKKKEFPANLRDDLLKGMIGKRKKFDTHVKYAHAGIDDILTPEEKKKALVLKANYFASCYIQNNGNGKFSIKPLPAMAQMAPLDGMVADDVNGDGNLDIILSGNDYGNEVVNGQYDAMNGLVLLGDGKGGFATVSMPKSGLLVTADAKGLAKLATGNHYTIAATENKGPLQLFALQNTGKIIRFNNNDVAAIIHLKNGKVRKEELYYGTSFMSQSARFILATDAVQQVEAIDGSGKKRTVYTF